MFDIELNTTEISNDSIKSEFTLQKTVDTLDECEEIESLSAEIKKLFKQISPHLENFSSLIDEGSEMFLTDKADAIKSINRSVDRTLEEVEVLMRNTANLDISKEVANAKDSLKPKYKTLLETEDLEPIRHDINEYGSWILAKAEGEKEKILFFDGCSNVTAFITPEGDDFSVSISKITYPGEGDYEVSSMESEFDDLYEEVKQVIREFVKFDIGSLLEDQGRYKSIVQKLNKGNIDHLLELTLLDFNTFYSEAIEKLSLYDVGSRFARLFSKVSNKRDVSEDLVEKLRVVKNRITNKVHQVLDRIEDLDNSVEKLSIFAVGDFLRLKEDEIAEQIILKGMNITTLKSVFDLKTLARFDKQLAVKLARSGEVALILAGLNMDGVDTKDASDSLGGYIQEKHYLKKAIAKKNQEFNSKVIGIASAICKAEQLKRNIFEDFHNTHLVEKVGTIKYFNHYCETLGRDIEVVADYEVHGYFGKAS